MIFVDRSIPRAVARALQQVRDDIRWLEDVFPANTPDEIWLRHCGEAGWMIISRDKRIRTRSAERRAIVRHSAGAFVLAHAVNLSRWELLRLTVSYLDEMERLFAETPRPFIFTITSAGIRAYKLD